MPRLVDNYSVNGSAKKCFDSRLRKRTLSDVPGLSDAIRKHANDPATYPVDGARGQESGTDDIVIGSAAPSGEEADVEGATMEDVAKLVASVKYLVKGWIPFGMVTGIVAEPGIGKSALALWLARSVMTGCDWFNGAKGPAKEEFVLWCPTENDMAITAHRMKSWGIPTNKLILPFKDDPLLPINLADARHLELMEGLINKYRTPLVVVDSLRGGHSGDENNSQVGSILQSLSGIAEKTHAAVKVVHHTRKLAVDDEITANSSRGSNAILAMFRSMIGIDRPDPTSKRCRMRILKENLGLAPDPVGFEVTNEGLVFGPPPTRPRRENAKDEAEQLLRESMRAGQWHKAAELEELAKQRGLSPNAMFRAKKALGILLKKERNAWFWKMPGDSVKS